MKGVALSIDRGFEKADQHSQHEAGEINERTQAPVSKTQTRSEGLAQLGAAVLPAWVVRSCKLTHQSTSSRTHTECGEGSGDEEKGGVWLLGLAPKWPRASSFLLRTC